MSRLARALFQCLVGVLLEFCWSFVWFCMVLYGFVGFVGFVDLSFCEILVFVGLYLRGCWGPMAIAEECRY